MLESTITMAAKTLDKMPKGVLFAVLAGFFAIDFVMSEALRPWWDLVIFTVAYANVVVSLVTRSIIATAMSAEFYTSAVLTLFKAVYLLNYALKHAHIQSFVVGLACGIVYAAVPAFYERWMLGTKVYESGETIIESVTTANIGGVFDGLLKILRTTGEDSSTAPKIVKETQKQPPSIAEEEIPDDLEDTINEALGDLGGESEDADELD